MKTKLALLAVVSLSVTSLSACSVASWAEHLDSSWPERTTVPVATLSAESPLQPDPIPTDRPVWLALPPGASSGDVAYLSSRSGMAEIWFLDLATGSERQLTESDCSDEMSGGYMPQWYVPGVQYFDWSPDGQKIAYLTSCKASTDRARLAVLDFEIGTTTVITSLVSQNSYPSWAPSSDRLVFTRDPVYGTEIDGRMYLVDLEKDDPKLEPVGGIAGKDCIASCYYAVWSSDGEHIAFRGPFVGLPGVGWRTYVSIVDLEGNHLAYKPESADKPKPNYRGAWMAEPTRDGLTWSSNGEYLALATFRLSGIEARLALVEVNDQTAVMNFGLSPHHPVNPSPFGPGFSNPVFSPDDEVLYFVSLWLDTDDINVEFPFGTIYSVPTQDLLGDSSPGIRAVSPEGQRAGFPSLSSDGEWLVYAVKVEEVSEIWLQAIDGTYRQQLVSDGSANTRPAWRPFSE
jgi:Tol biopolymer transport system component